MEECLYFTMVGSTPNAVANSFIWFLRMKTDFVVKEVFFICSEENISHGLEGTARNIPEVIDLIQESAEKLNLKEYNNIKFNKIPVLIPEANLPIAAQNIAKAILSERS